MSTMTESTTTAGTFIKGDVPDSWIGKAFSGIASIVKGEAAAPEVMQPAGFLLTVGVGLGADYLGNKAAQEGKGPAIKFRKPLY